MSNQTVIYFTCDVCEARSNTKEGGNPTGWAKAEIKFFNIPRYTTNHKFDICPACILPDTNNEKPENVGTFKKIYLAITASFNR